MTKNHAAVLYGVNDVRVVTWPVPEINDNEVLVKMASVGICGSDVKIVSTGRCGLEALQGPMVLGHEGAGTVVKVGSKVTKFSVGDRVAIEPLQSCGSCSRCRDGRENLCERSRHCATTAWPGNLARYYAHSADFCHKLPDNLSMDEGAAVQPLAIAIHACNRAEVRLGTTLAVLGAGPIGLLCALAAKAMGATKILITDVVQSRLDTAKEMGVDHTLLIKREDSDQDIVDTIIAILGQRPDITMDACALPATQSVAMMVTRSAGVVLVVGIGDERVEVPLAGALLREVDVRGSYRISGTYPAALTAVSRGSIDLQRFITHHYRLEDIVEALALAKSGAAMKIIIHVDS